jgi:ribosomal protein S18 acetylase RimI-like enzyme
MDKINLSEFIIKDNYSEMDFDKVTSMLTNAYWCKGIQKPEVIKSAQNSALCVGVFYNNEQIGFARTVSDKTRFAYIQDVIVDDNYQKQGIGQMMMRHLLNHLELAEVYQWLLITRDAHGVYQKVGFSPVSRPNDWMEIRNTRPDR